MLRTNRIRRTGSRQTIIPPPATLIRRTSQVPRHRSITPIVILQTGMKIWIRNSVVNKRNVDPRNKNNVYFLYEQIAGGLEVIAVDLPAQGALAHSASRSVTTAQRTR